MTALAQTGSCTTAVPATTATYGTVEVQGLNIAL
jgi:hypothetical protein